VQCLKNTPNRFPYNNETNEWIKLVHFLVLRLGEKWMRGCAGKKEGTLAWITKSASKSAV
jgi:hypothetical protein